MAHPADAGAKGHVFVDGLGDELTLDGEDGHHLSRVLRLRVGEVVTAADGKGTWRPYAVAEVVRAGLTLVAAGPAQEEPEPPVTVAVAFALTKGGKPELTVQKLTELGVNRILPVLGARSVARPAPDRAAADLVRWQRVAAEAAKQCRRSRLPAVEPLAPVTSLAGHPALVVAERGGVGVDSLAVPPAGEVLVAVGPEGGWERGEVEGLRPWATITLGPHVLRAETAALAAAATLAARYRPG
jgi:16S rRNA (uracil1498-N3)-methyltransferase